MPRLSAFIGTYLAIAIVWLPPRMGFALSLLSLTLIFAGVGFSVHALAHLGRAFSLMAEARQLVSDGPYAHVRHPLYLGEAVAMLGLLLHITYRRSPSPSSRCNTPFNELERMAHEKDVLAGNFPITLPIAPAPRCALIPGLY